MAVNRLKHTAKGKCLQAIAVLIIIKKENKQICLNLISYKIENIV